MELVTLVAVYRYHSNSADCDSRRNTETRNLRGGWELLEHDQLENQICCSFAPRGSGPAGCLLETPTASRARLSEVRWAGSFLSKTISSSLILPPGRGIRSNHSSLRNARDGVSEICFLVVLYVWMRILKINLGSSPPRREDCSFSLRTLRRRFQLENWELSVGRVPRSFKHDCASSYKRRKRDLVWRV